MRYLIKFSYDGSKFYGFQRLNERKSVQKEIEDALKSFTREDVEIKGAGRTDRGVHAYMQCAHFDLEKELESSKILFELNRKTSPYLSFSSCDVVNNNFHARFDVKEKTYVYKINVGEHSPFKADYYLNYKDAISIKKLKEASRIFKGVHDFRNFVSGERNDYTCIIYDIKIVKEKDTISMYFRGKSFYRYMVRNLVGAMLDYNKGKVTLEELKDMLNKPDIKKQLSTASGEGLYLLNIKY